MNEATQKVEKIKEGARYVEEYFRIGKGIQADIHLIEEIIDIYEDYKLLTEILEDE